jgi:hypothetical protein
MRGTWAEKRLHFGNWMTEEKKGCRFSMFSTINQSESESILKDTA